MIIWLASYPRSGNTFFRMLLNHIYSIQTYSVYNDPLFDQLDGVKDIVGHKKLSMSFDEMAKSGETFFVKTHHLPTDDFPAIYLVRDGRDSIISYAKFISSFSEHKSNKLGIRKFFPFLLKKNNKRILQQLIVQSETAYGGWSDNVIQWTESKKGQTVIVYFEDLIQEPVEQIQDALRELQISNTVLSENNTFPSFDELHSQWPNFFRKGKRNTWKNEMSLDLQELFWKYHGETMTKLNYSKK